MRSICSTSVKNFIKNFARNKQKSEVLSELIKKDYGILQYF